jgi:heat shock protein HtpX
MKRVLLFLITNLAVMLVLGTAASILGVNRYLTAQRLNLGLLLGFAAVMGFGGAFVSLLLSRTRRCSRTRSPTSPTATW